MRKESCIPESIFSIMSNKCLQKDYLSRSSPNELKMLLQELLSMLVEYLWYINNARYFFDEVKFKNRLWSIIDRFLDIKWTLELQ